MPAEFRFRTSHFRTSSGLMARPIYFASAADLHAWLKNNHENCRELLVGFYKKSSGKASLTYQEALDEALCFGWIDGVRKRVNAEAYSIRFTPRKVKSQWSAVNIKRVRELSGAGRMQGSGLKAFAGAEKQKRKYSYEQRQEACLSKEDQRRFRSNSSAWAFFEAQPPGYRKIATFWVISAKRERTRERRLGVLISAPAAGRRIDLLAPSSVPKRQSAGGTET
jgi:uncharacterized protein YdeI (YjbR/CyaY-like superfamily)